MVKARAAAQNWRKTRNEPQRCGSRKAAESSDEGSMGTRAHSRRSSLRITLNACMSYRPMQARNQALHLVGAPAKGTALSIAHRYCGAAAMAIALTGSVPVATERTEVSVPELMVYASRSGFPAESVASR